MKSNRRTATVLGLLLLFSFVFGILSSVPALEYPDYLVKLAEIEIQVMIATFSQAAMAVVYVSIAVILYPIIKKYNKNLALGYFGLRIIGAGFLFVAIVPFLLLLWLSQSYIAVGQADLSHFEITAELLRQGRDILNHIGMILPWSIGGLILYYCLYKIRLIPRWLSIWGIIGSTFTLLATLLLMFNIIKIVSLAYFIFNAPLALCELILAFYLLVRGFNPIEKNQNEKGSRI
ncbi:DUF4386 domain-containing protein [Anaerobacillus isosaccharinicus]|uniref:DUF4386 domain-containing protein n=1 Tax=Anaerobacillus isosaccharinicus TaxID=1532552 RepID=A0A1S2LC09_9BACI|nr:DUF4386 domain-containing protein [Anaerobacillus isosaccharinicus]MBA5584876.1 DUF4386 domain-containing protein [Anaerobacillus isosaccharinicus]QOY36763.1 DUF4386 domain-containing protein [Anaerobacillus isosaccharinicus]